MRIAFGQLMEYGYYPDRKDAQKLFLVSDVEPDEDFISYIMHLNKLINIPIGYIQFDLKKKDILYQSHVIC